MTINQSLLLPPRRARINRNQPRRTINPLPRKPMINPNPPANPNRPRRMTRNQSLLERRRLLVRNPSLLERGRRMIRPRVTRRRARLRAWVMDTSGELGNKVKEIAEYCVE
jgi:hypothetical protein